MVSGDADDVILQIYTRTYSPSDFFCSSSPLLTSSWCICFHRVRFFWLLINILVPEASLPSRLQQWANTFDCPEQKGVVSDHQVISYCQPCLLEDMSHSQPQRIWTILDHWRSASTPCPPSPYWIIQGLYRKTDNEVGFYLSKVRHKLLFRIASREKNTSMPVKGFLRMSLAPPRVYIFQY